VPNTATGWARLSAAGELLDIDATAARIAGYASVEEARSAGGTPWPLRRAREWVRSPQAAERPRSFEERSAPADGRDERCARSLVVPARDASRPGGCFDVYVEECAAVGHAARAELLGRALEALPNPVFVKDAQHRWVLLNDAYCRFMGYDRGELLGKSDPDFFPSGEAEVFWRRDDVVFASGELDESEERFTDAQGHTHIILTRKTLHVDAEGRRYVIGVITDISERTRMEQEVRRSRDELDRRVRERTAALERLNVQLQEEDRRKNDFIAVLSHELRNPLAPVQNALHILERVEPGSAPARDARAVIRHQVDHLGALLDDLLDITRISRGKIRLQLDRVDLARAVAQSVDDHRPLLADRGIAVELELPDGPLVAQADPTRIAQVVANLLQNAAKFTGRGGTVRVSLGREASGEAVLRVRDSGVGIDPRVLDRLFQPFAQADESLDRTAGGLGLGLALVKGLAELHGGSVEARSEGRDRGAEFTVRLPALADAQPRPAPARTRPPRRAGPRRVLVVEDNVEAAETLRVVLELESHQVEVARDGRAGLARARAFRPDLILCDLGLPVMDGYAVARAIRADPQLAGIELVAVSGYALPEDRRRSAEAGFDRHLPKPVPLEALEELLASGVRAGEGQGEQTRVEEMRRETPRGEAAQRRAAR
jgi:PAS domain S-box-containing protein